MADSFDCNDELHAMDRRIVDAVTARADARLAYARSPNAERRTLRDMAERTVNELLERRHELLTAERIVRA